MRYDSCQYGSFDGLDNRRELMILFQRLGGSLPEVLRREKRAEFLRKIIKLSKNGFAAKAVQITPCDPVQAYHIFVAITGCLGVDINIAAKMLEDEVSRPEVSWNNQQDDIAGDMRNLAKKIIAEA